MFGKIFECMYEGTLYGHWQALVTFQQMIVLADRDGVVDMTPHAIAARTSIPLKIITAGISHLEQPDEYSRTPDREGRRIERLDAHRPWGWRIVNYLYYRNLQDAETVREQNRERQRRKRERDSHADVTDVSRDVTGVTRGTTESRHAEAEADTEANKKVPTEPVELGRNDPVVRVFDHWRQTHRHPRAQLDSKRRKVISAALKLYSEADLCLAITGYLNSAHHMGKNDRGVVYDDIEIFLRDAKHIDAGLRHNAEPARSDLSQLTRRNVAATEDWVPPEMRRATN